jgi:Tripartite tricarboxylate transporter family receptor
MIPKSGHRFPACAKPLSAVRPSFDASASEGRSDKIMLGKPTIALRSRRDSRFLIPDRVLVAPNGGLKVGKIRNLALAAAALALVTAQLAGLPWPALAQDYPSRPIRVLIAFPPGGPTDFVGRLLADKMSMLLGQRVYIENKPGANGTVGADIIAKSDPDGYSLFLTTAGAVTISPHVMANLPYESLRDFAPVAEVVTNTTVLVVTPKTPIKNRQGAGRARQAKTRRDHVRFDRHRVNDAFGASTPCRCRGRQLPPCALSRPPRRC